MTTIQDRILPTDTPAEGADAYATDEERRIAYDFCHETTGKYNAGWLIFYRGTTRVLLITTGRNRKNKFLSFRQADGTYTKPVQTFDYPEA